MYVFPYIYSNIYIIFSIYLNEYTTKFNFKTIYNSLNSGESDNTNINEYNAVFNEICANLI